MPAALLFQRVLCESGIYDVPYPGMDVFFHVGSCLMGVDYGDLLLGIHQHP